MMFTGDSDGSVRAYKLPLTKGAEYQEQHCTRGPISRLALNFDETLLFVGSSDGCVCVFDVKDRVSS